ncbi:hypothetical protein SETIT_2G166100v2 [Setaria italica]|uniref:Uncharacterized protein n=1 Tax=Setaria italica TaxID=4555 RepID=A0A368PZU4_SETIT|nr:hypothetical protein SETIT_2G166100v2 [Setaria italica]
MESILKQLASKIGGLVTVEMRAIATDGGDFHRARVNLEMSRPLLRFVTLTPEGWDSILIQVKYEKIPRFCSHCGLMGVHGNTGVEREQPKEECGACPPRGRGGGQGGWGPYPRRGVWMEKKEAGLDKGSDVELSDAATSHVEPMEEKHVMSREVLAKKQLSMTAELSNKVEIGVPPPHPMYISLREKKKQKKLIESEKDVPNTSMVDSEKEDHREQ